MDNGKGRRMLKRISSGIDRRSGKDRRRAYSIEYFLTGGVEHRKGIERRLGVERRSGWIKAGKWESVFQWKIEESESRIFDLKQHHKNI